MKHTRSSQLISTLAVPNQEQYSIARKMLSRRFPASSVCRITQLSGAEVEALKHEIGQTSIAQETLDQLQVKTHNRNREIHLLATQKIDEKQAQQQAPWLFEDDWYLGYRTHQQRLGTFTTEV